MANQNRQKYTTLVVGITAASIAIPTTAFGIAHGRKILQDIRDKGQKAKLDRPTFDAGAKELEKLPKTKGGKAFSQNSRPAPGNKRNVAAIGDPWICTTDRGSIQECVHYLGNGILACFNDKGVLKNINFIFANPKKSDYIDEMYRYYPASGQWRFADLPGNERTRVPACNETLPGSRKSGAPSNAWLNRFNNTDQTFMHMSGAISAGPPRAVLVHFIRNPSSFTTALPFANTQEMAGTQYLGIMLLATRLRGDRYLGPRKDFNNKSLRIYQRQMSPNEEAVATEVFAYGYTAAIKGL